MKPMTRLLKALSQISPVRLSPHWRRVWRRLSFQSLSWSLAGLTGWQSLPEDLKTEISPRLAVWVLGGLLLFGLAGSVVDQPKAWASDDRKGDDRDSDRDNDRDNEKDERNRREGESGDDGERKGGE